MTYEALTSAGVLDLDSDAEADDCSGLFVAGEGDTLTWGDAALVSIATTVAVAAVVVTV